ncbi:MAG: hypothetical protein LBP70_00300 [Mycoplasmataceae bacterium]|nr:hypothetical protein [Mycoplasmataceae bacterium]
MKIKSVKNVLIPLMIAVGVVFSFAIVTTSCSSTKAIKFALHRGLSSRFFENTSYSFEGAGEIASVWGIETDIYLTKNDDNGYHPLVCSHDINPFRQTNSNLRDAAGSVSGSIGVCNPTPSAYDLLWNPTTGTKITDLTLNQVKDKELWTGYCGENLDPTVGNVGDWIVLNNEYNAYGISGDYVVPTFKEYLTICKNHNKEAVIEIKDENSFWGADYASTLILEMINEINEVDWANHCTVIAFDGSVFDTAKPDQPYWHELKNACENPAPDISKTANILFNKFEKLCWGDYGHQDPLAEAYRAVYNHQNIDVDKSILLDSGGGDLIKFAHENNLIVNSWTVNDINDRDNLIKLDIDQMTTNVLW